MFVIALSQLEEAYVYVAYEIMNMKQDEASRFCLQGH